MATARQASHGPSWRPGRWRQVVLSLFWLPLLVGSFPAYSTTPATAAWEISGTAPQAAAGGTLLLRAQVKIAPGWHLYSASTAAGIPVSFRVSPETLATVTGVFQRPPKRSFDTNFDVETETFTGEATFLIETRLAREAPAGPSDLAVSARFQTCNESQCVPGHWNGTARIIVGDGPAGAAAPAGFWRAVKATASAPRATTTPAAGADGGLGGFLLLAFGFGLASLLTPCVFPMIPITMSYFLGGREDRKSPLVPAAVFCLGIAVMFTALGLGLTAALGPFAVVQMGSNRWVNGAIAALFVAFGLSLLGLFEISAPSGVLTRLNRGAERGGLAGTLLMGLTFALASFACVGPFVGTLLAASVGTSQVRPAAGMLAFSAGLALPFFLLALFPAYLGKLPRSGGWMIQVKGVLGFLILAASLKYWSSVDQVMRWGLLTRNRFLAIWVVLVALAGLYVLGIVRFERGGRRPKLGGLRLTCGVALIAAALALVPGMFGSHLGELEAYIPADADSARGPIWMQNQYAAALARAQAGNKRVLVDFTGYACTNCHWMKANLFTRPEVAAALGEFVLVELYTDGTDSESEANQALQLSQFQTVAIPFYAIADASGTTLATFPGSTRDAKEFLAFLRKGKAEK
jgi:thiol:disulfide interchange protein